MKTQGQLKTQQLGNVEYVSKKSTYFIQKGWCQLKCPAVQVYSLHCTTVHSVVPDGSLVLYFRTGFKVFDNPHEPCRPITDKAR